MMVVLTQIFTDLGGLSQHCACLCHGCVICVYCCRGGIQPERLNAEGDSPSAFSLGWSDSATPGTIAPKEKPLEDAKAAAEEADIRVLLASNRASQYRGLRSATPSAKSHSLRSGLRPFRSRSGIFFHRFSQIWADYHNIVVISSMFVLSVFFI